MDINSLTYIGAVLAIVLPVGGCLFAIVKYFAKRNTKEVVQDVKIESLEGDVDDLQSRMIDVEKQSAANSNSGKKNS